MLEWFSFLLRVNCVILVRAINTDVWQAMVARASESQKDSRETRTATGSELFSLLTWPPLKTRSIKICETILS